ncbi:MAG TPA: T9SS type A sorting domain-containing protein [Candidatus Kapabacteria bacterium]|nr:T9SS type A sorting domain-containing protein [Candidatus Kapabacteria bacterium]
MVRLVAVMLFIVIHANDSTGQWVKSGSFPTFSSPQTPYGQLIYKSGVLWGGYNYLLKSTDSAKTWSMPLSSIDLDGRIISCISFLDAFRGAICNGDKLYFTKDGGLTWQPQAILVAGTGQQAEPLEAIYAGDTSTVVCITVDGIYTSTNGGTTFIRTFVGPVLTSLTYGKAGKVCVLQGYNTIVSTDYGQTWTPYPIDHAIVDSYSMDFDVCDSTVLYLANEDFYYRLDSFSEAFITRDLGGTWQSKLRRSLDVISGGLSVTENAAYFITLDSGLYRTIDAGAHWVNIPPDSAGPFFFVDTKWLAAISDNILVAVDRQGYVWRTNNAGGYPPPARGLPVLNEIPTIKMPQCSSDSESIFVISPNCKTFTIKSIHITGSESKSITATSRTTLPVSLSRGATDTIDVFTSIQDTAGYLQDTIWITWNDGAGDRDTALFVTLFISPAPITLSIEEPTITFDSLARCDLPSDTTVTITNHSCASITLRSIKDQLGTGFSMDSIKLPLLLDPDSSIQIHLYFSAKTGGTFNGKLILRWTSGDVERYDTIKLVGKAAIDRGSLTIYDSVLNFGTVNFCFAGITRDSLIRIRNHSCDTLRILSGPGSLSFPFSIDAHTLPIIIPPDSVFEFQAVFQPSSTGTFTDSLVYGGNRSGENKNIIIRFLGKSIYQKTSPLVSDSVIDFGTTPFCHSDRDTVIWLTNHGCDSICLTAALFTNLGISFTVGALPLPICLPPDSALALHISFKPKDTTAYSGSISFSTLRDNASEQLTLKLKGLSTVHNAGPLVLNPTIEFDTLSICDVKRDSIIRLTNRGCDTLRILSSSGTFTSGFTIDPLLYPIDIPPDSSIVVTLHFKPIGKGSATETIRFTTKREGLSSSEDITLHGVATYGPSEFILLTPTIAFGLIPLCGSDSAEVRYTNLGCDTVFVTPTSFNGDPDFSGGVGTETAVASGDTIRLKVLLTPTQKGSRNSKYVLHIRNASGVTSDTVVAISADILDATRLLQSSVATIDFPTQPVCAPAYDTTITITNTGCGLLRILDYAITGDGYSVQPQPPFNILPKQSQQVHIIATPITTDHRLTNSGSVFIISTSDVPLAPIVVSQSYIYPKVYSLRIGTPVWRTRNPDTVSIGIYADSLPKGLTEIDASISVANINLLTFTHYTSSNTVTQVGDMFSITGNPIGNPNGLLAELFYKVYLTNDSTTAITVNDIKFNPNDPGFQNCVASVSPRDSNGFEYIFHCGDRLILSSGFGEQNIRIMGIHPNPTDAKITADISIKAATDGYITVTDVLGKEVVSTFRHFEAGDSQIDLDLTAIASGVYILRIGQTETSFIKSR